MLKGNFAPALTRMDAPRSKSAPTISGVFASFCIWFRNSANACGSALLHQAVLHAIVHDQPADVQVVNPMAEFLIFGRFAAGNVAIADADDQLRHAVAQAHRFQIDCAARCSAVSGFFGFAYRPGAIRGDSEHQSRERAGKSHDPSIEYPRSG